MSDDSLDTLIEGKLRLYQSRMGYRFSLDALLLAHFVTVKPRERVVDLGAGNGTIALLLSHLHPSASITAVEVQAAMTERAMRSVALNGLEERVAIVAGDLRDIGSVLAPSYFDAAVSNVTQERAITPLRACWAIPEALAPRRAPKDGGGTG